MIALFAALLALSQSSGTALDRAREALVRGESELKSDPAAAVRSFREASSQASDDPRLRKRALELRAKAAREAKMPVEQKKIELLKTHDVLLETLRRRKSFAAAERADLEKKLEAAADDYREDRDTDRVEMTKATRALLSIRSGELEAGIKLAQAVASDEKKSRAARSIALEALWNAGEAEKNLEAAVTAALALNGLINESKTDEQRRYARVTGLDALCTRYDAKSGTGSCARLEKKTTGRFTFTDHSRGSTRRELSDADLQRVHSQLLPALEDCVLTAAKKAPDVFVNSDVEIAWAIQPKGNATDLEVTPKRVRPDVEGCVGERLSWARYPRFKSQERKAVRVPYHLDEKITF